MKLITGIALVALIGAAIAQEAVPECRQKVLNETTGEEHLITRDNGVMGCISHAECIQYTNAASWCKPDGTCRGCDDWEGCCDLLPPEQPAGVPCYAADELPTMSPEDVATFQNVLCTIDTECSKSYCQEDGTCRPCEPEEDFEEPIAPCFASGLFPSLAQEEGNDYCRSLTGCMESECRFMANTTGSAQIGFCYDLCDETSEEYTPSLPFIGCPVASDEVAVSFANSFCTDMTGCSTSYCIAAENLVDESIGYCHPCEPDDVDPAEPTVCNATEAASGAEGAWSENLGCKYQTGCSSSYCKSDNSCFSCEDDGFDIFSTVAPCFMMPETIRDPFCHLLQGCGESYCSADGQCTSCEGREVGVETPCVFGDEDLGFGSDLWCTLGNGCNLFESVSECQTNNICSPCTPFPVEAGSPDIVNPTDPECRQFFVFEGEAHLITRDDGETMGCVSNEECTEHTGPASWCKADGTCHGCEDWEGCCAPLQII